MVQLYTTYTTVLYTLFLMDFYISDEVQKNRINGNTLQYDSQKQYIKTSVVTEECMRKKQISN